MILALLTALFVGAVPVAVFAQSGHSGHASANAVDPFHDAQVSRLIRLVNETNVASHIRSVSLSLTKQGKPLAVDVKPSATKGAHAPAAVAFARRVKSTSFGASALSVKRKRIQLTLIN